MKTFVALIILIAVSVGIMALELTRAQLIHLIIFRDFFDIAIPILAFGALIKYLCTSTKCPHCKQETVKESNNLSLSNKNKIDVESHSPFGTLSPMREREGNC